MQRARQVGAARPATVDARLPRASSACEIWNFIVPAAASVIGAAMASDAQSDAVQTNVQGQREFAQKGISWRVKDAKEAGLHPLYALGANLPSFNPISVMSDPMGEGIAAAGAAVGRGLERWQDKRDIEFEKQAKDINEAGQRIAAAEILDEQLAQSRIQTDLMELQLQDAKDKRLQQAATANKERAALTPDPVKPLDAIEYKPDQVLSARGKEDWVTAGQHPGWTEFRLHKGFNMILPAGGSMSESLESVSESTAILAAVVAVNVERYGEQWLTRARKFLPDIFGRTKQGGEVLPFMH